jgi:predicted nucleic acid-binding protein
MLEMANGFITVSRRRLLSPDYMERCLVEIEDLIATAVQQSQSGLSFRSALSVARTFELTAYDAAYLETARREQIPLATLDRALSAAAAVAGVPLFA